MNAQNIAKFRNLNKNFRNYFFEIYKKIFEIKISNLNKKYRNYFFEIKIKNFEIWLSSWPKFPALNFTPKKTNTVK